MKKYLLSALMIFGTGAVIQNSLQSCTALASSDIGVSVIKQLLLGGVNKGMDIFSNKDSFLKNNLIDMALPQSLRDINATLQKVAPSLVQKEKEYIAQAASYTVNISRPILNDAINSLNSNDVVRIMQGPKGTATMVLKEKTATQLMNAIAPKVDEELNKFGIVKTINTALSGSSLLGSLLGNNTTTSQTGGLSRMASEQIVNGLFNIIEDHEKQNGLPSINSILK